MEDACKTVATVMAIGILTTTVGILLAAWIQTQMVPWAILAAKFVWEWGCFLSSRFTEFLLNRIFALARLLATFVQNFIFQRTAAALTLFAYSTNAAPVATAGHENDDIQMDVESNELGEGNAQVGELDAGEGEIQGGSQVELRAPCINGWSAPET